MEITKNPLVCFFDSGIGGLNLLYECIKKLPQVNFTYFSDSKRMPYGNLTHDELLKFTDEAFLKISELNPKAVVTACNTVTAECIEFLRQKYKFPIIGIQPAVKPASKVGGKCLILVTAATANSLSFKKLVEDYAKDAEVYPCKNLAEYIEKNVFNLSRSEICDQLPKLKPDSVVLGCTHYVFAKDIISKFYGCPVFDGMEGTAERLRSVLQINGEKMAREQKILFCGGAEEKNRLVLDMLFIKNGILTDKIKK